jgi:hypothetical protein
MACAHDRLAFGAPAEPVSQISDIGSGGSMRLNQWPPVRSPVAFPSTVQPLQGSGAEWLPGNVVTGMLPRERTGV